MLRTWEAPALLRGVVCKGRQSERHKGMRPETVLSSDGCMRQETLQVGGRLLSRRAVATCFWGVLSSIVL